MSDYSSTTNEELVNGTYITVRDYDTLEEVVNVYDLFNARISERINGPYTLDFNVLPYKDVSRIYPPNILEIDNDYFQISRIQKVRSESLMMTINCEHVSYELNEPPYNDYEWTEDTYSGRISDILGELIEGSRFQIGIVESRVDGYIREFTTDAKGFRSRILELAAQVNAEVLWDKFTVSLVERRGNDNGITLEVGKNILGMTQNIERRNFGRLRRSYEVDIVDLHHIDGEDNQPLELHSIELGDTVTLIDDQFLVNQTDRIVSLIRDPFQKVLPEIEFSNGMNDFLQSDNTTTEPATISVAEESLLKFYSETDIVHVANIQEGAMELLITANLDVAKETDVICGLNIRGAASQETVIGFNVMIDGSLSFNNITHIVKAMDTPMMGTTDIMFSIDIPFAHMGLEPGRFKEIYVIMAAFAGTITIPRAEASFYIKGKHINHVSSS